jgi:hypothetical protein
LIRVSTQATRRPSGLIAASNCVASRAPSGAGGMRVRRRARASAVKTRPGSPTLNAMRRPARSIVGRE